jgi:hypothetical protein
MSKNPVKGTDFIFRLSGIELPADVADRIAAEIRATVMRELAKTDLRGKTGAKGKLGAGGGGGAGVLIPASWRGGILINAAALKEAVANFDRVTLQVQVREVGG